MINNQHETVRLFAMTQQTQSVKRSQKYCQNASTILFFRGLVPISYINIIVDMMNVQHETAVTVHENLLPDTFHKVLYTFHGQMEGDLSVAEGEVVRVCEKQNEDW